MLIFPSVKDRFTSSKTSDEVCGLLQRVTESRYISFLTDCEFIGRMDVSSFSIQPYIQGRNSFLPMIKGKVFPKDGGSEVVIQMKLCLSVAVFMAVWFGGTGFFFLCGIVAVIADGIRNAWQLPAMAAGMFVAGQVLMRASFFYSAKKAQKKLRELLL